MIGINQRYVGIETFKNKIENYQLGKGSSCLVKIITSIMDPKEAVRTAGEIKNILPEAVIVGASSSGIIFEGKQYESETMVLIEKYDSLKIKRRIFTWDRKTAGQVAAEVFRAFQNGSQETVHILFSDQYYDVNNFVEEMNRCTPILPLAGGIVGDLLHNNTPGYLFTDEGLIPKGAVAYSVSGETASCFIGVNTAQEPISPVFEVTCAEGNFIKTIENEPADQWMFRYLAIEDMRSFKDWKSIADNDHLIRFQMILEGHSNAGRFTRYDEEKQCLALYFSQLPSGTKFRIGYTNPTKCVHDCYELCQHIMKQPVENIFVYTCLFRKLYMQNSSRWELLPLAEYKVCGMFMMGEIGFINGKNEFFNGSCLVTGIAESERFVMPDISVFDSLSQIEDDSDMMKFALTRQKETISAENRELMDKLIRQREEARKGMYLDSQMGLPNVLMYQEDKKKYHFDKLCMVKVENYDMLVTYAGQDAYIENTKEIIREVDHFIEKHHYQEDVMFYCVNQSTFFYAGKVDISESHFKHIIQKIYKNFHFYKSTKTGLPQITRFVLVLRQKDLLESGLNSLQATKDIQSHFFVCDSKMKMTLTYAEELKVIELLNRAIHRGGVTPYYQGIRDNITSSIDKYEALMRLTDEDGSVYPPSVFMDIAKKYHLYSKLSRSMIDRVLNDFEKRTEKVSVNLSMYDIDSKEFRNWFFGRLKNFPDPKRVMVEFVETEDCASSEELHAFIRTLREIGSQIAVDDFGTGYSTLSEIVRMEPDYIKIDGGIVRELESNPKSLVSLKTIIFLARQLQIRTIAEFVENEKIQAILEENGVDYSQGYLFAKPVPLREIS